MMINENKSSHGIQVHGILWIFEQFVAKKVITPRKAHTDLSQLITLNHRHLEALKEPIKKAALPKLKQMMQEAPKEAA